MTREEILAKWDSMKPHERNDLIFYDVLDRMPLDTAPNEFGGFGTIPRYTQDLSAAWEVVEKLKESHLYTDIRTCADFYEVWITDHATGNESETYAHPRLPEAICKAALLAVMDQEDTHD